MQGGSAGDPWRQAEAYLIAHGHTAATIQEVPLDLMAIVARWMASGWFGPRAGMQPAARIVSQIRDLQVTVASFGGYKGKPKPLTTGGVFRAWKDL